jgi:hypothetical protein
MKGNELFQKLDIFRNLLHPSLHHLITISARYDLRSDWPKTWPDNEKPGVYFLLDEQEGIIFMMLDPQVLETHKQLNEFSCIPMSIEFVLKLLGRVDVKYFDLQITWNDRQDGSFAQFDGKTIKGIKFTRQFSLPRDDKFPLENLFSIIKEELNHERYVIISLEVSGGWHNYIIFDQIPNGEFKAITKGQQHEQINNVCEVVRKMKGTDILTYVAM